MISAKVIADSISREGKRLTTIEYVAPRFILAQFNTHRAFSRNAGSSRAIPTTRIIERVLENPVIPVWTSNKPGMQGDFDITDEEAAELTQIWLDARDDAVKHAQRFLDRPKKAHKQAANRILEPYLYFVGVVSSTEWENWFALREHDAAQPEIAILAKAFREAIESSKPQLILEGQWHLPYVFGEEKSLLIDTQIKISVARCARVSYRTHDDGKISSVEKDEALFTQLFEEKHASPLEHQAQPDSYVIHNGQPIKEWSNPFLHGNFVGWKQFRRQVGI